MFTSIGFYIKEQIEELSFLVVPVLFGVWRSVEYFETKN
jgi:hypothetical protein